METVQPRRRGCLSTIVAEAAVMWYSSHESAVPPAVTEALLNEESTTLRSGR